jgi:hypothetical protein
MDEPCYPDASNISKAHPHRGALMSVRADRRFVGGGSKGRPNRDFGTKCSSILIAEWPTRSTPELPKRNRGTCSAMMPIRRGFPSRFTCERGSPSGLHSLEDARAPICFTKLPGKGFVSGACIPGVWAEAAGRARRPSPSAKTVGGARLAPYAGSEGSFRGSQTEEGLLSKRLISRTRILRLLRRSRRPAIGRILCALGLCASPADRGPRFEALP